MKLPCRNVRNLISNAYLIFANGVDAHPENDRLTQVEGAPDWIGSSANPRGSKFFYTIEAKAESPQSRFMMMGPMLQIILEDRFKLKVHWETREVPVYALTVAKNGPKLKPYVEGVVLRFQYPVPYIRQSCRSFRLVESSVIET